MAGTKPKVHVQPSLGLRGFRPTPRYFQEKIIQTLLFLAALLSIFTTLAIITVLVFETVNFFGEVSLIEFLTDTRWTPLFPSKHFGIWPLLVATLLIAVISMLVALPIGLASAIFLSEYAPDKVRRAIKPVLEILAGIPTVVYGYFALLFVTPLLRFLFPDISVFNALSAGLVMGVMILPMVASLSEDAMSAVPLSLREAAYALGAKRHEVALQVVVPAALSGIIASFILAFSRAVGETMIVAIAAGQTPVLSLNPLLAMETITAYIVQVSLGDTPYGTIEYRTIFAVGMTLFLMTLVMNILSDMVVRRFREVYE